MENNMIKKYLFLALFITGCSSNNINAPNPKEEKTSDTSYEVSNLLIDSTSVLPDPVPLMETTVTIKEVSRVISFTNSGTSSFPMSAIQLVTSPGFSIKLNRCGVALSAKSSCQITVAFSNRGLLDGTYNAELKITSEASLQLSGSVTGVLNPASGGTVVLSMSLNSPFQPLGSSPTRTLTIKNSGTGNATDVVTVIPPEYVLKINHCSTTLKPNKSCTMQVMLKNYRTGAVVPETTISVSAKDPSSAVISKTISPKTGEEPSSAYLIDVLVGGSGLQYSQGVFLEDGRFVFSASIDEGPGQGVYVINPTTSEVSILYSIPTPEWNNSGLAQMLSSRGISNFTVAPTTGDTTGYVTDNNETMISSGAHCLFVEDYSFSGDVDGQSAQLFNYQDLIDSGLTQNVGSDADCYQFLVDNYYGYDPMAEGESIIVAKYLTSVSFKKLYIYPTRFFPVNDEYFIITGNFGGRASIVINEPTPYGQVTGSVQVEKLIDQNLRLVKRSGANNF